MLRRPGGFGFDRYSGIYLFVVFIVVFGIWSPHLFLTLATAQSIASTYSISGVLALAVLVPLCAGQFDLSVGANANLTAIAVVVLISNDHFGLVPAIAIGLLIGLGIGLLNALIVVKLRVSSFIATLGMTSILAATQDIVSNSTQPSPPPSTAWSDLTQFTVGGFQIVILYLLVIAFVLWWFLDHTPGGRYLYALGGNTEAARLSGVRVERWTVISLAMSGFIAGIAGVLYASLSGPSLSFGATLLLPAFAAAYLGSTQLRPGKFNVWGTLLAIFVLATGVQGLALVSGYQWLNDMFNGVAVIAAVALAVNRRSAKSAQSSHKGTEVEAIAAPDLDVAAAKQETDGQAVPLSTSTSPQGSSEG